VNLITPFKDITVEGQPKIHSDIAASGNTSNRHFWYAYSTFDFTTLQELSGSQALETCLGISAAPRLLQRVLKDHTNLRIVVTVDRMS
jgi:hypothetical protein